MPLCIYDVDAAIKMFEIRVVKNSVFLRIQISEYSEGNNSNNSNFLTIFFSFEKGLLKNDFMMFLYKKVRIF